MKKEFSDAEKYKYKKEKYHEFISKVHDICSDSEITQFAVGRWGFNYLDQLYYQDREIFCIYLASLVSFLNSDKMKYLKHHQKEFAASFNC